MSVHIVNLHYMLLQIRFVQGDEIPLSPNFRRDSCHLTLCLNHPSETDRLRYFLGISKVLREKNLEPRVHWGKYFDLNDVEIIDLYPNVKTFLKIREKLDPDQIFLNSLLSRTFSI